MEEISGGELLARALSARGVSRVFTASTRRLEPLLEALEAEAGIELVYARNETAATLMADGYVRRSGRFAAALTDDNGAALSQMGGVTNAWSDKVPLLSLSLCSDEEADFNKGFDRYRFDQNGAFHPVTSWRKRLSSPQEAPPVIHEAVQQSLKHKRGPVHIDIPAGFLKERVGTEALSGLEGPSEEEGMITPLRMPGDERAVSQAASVIMNAERPLLFCGAGVHSSGAHDEIIEFIETFQIPAATSMAGVGTVPSDHELSLGSPSYTGGETFHVAIKEADVVIAVGVSFSGLEGFGLPPLWSGDIDFVHIDISPFQIGLNVQPRVSILGDAGTVIGQLTDEMRKAGFEGRPGWKRWRDGLAELKAGRTRRLDRNANRPWETIHQGKIAQEIGRLLVRDDLLMVIDGGNTPLYAAMYAPRIKPRQAFFPFGMSSLGAGIPYAIGVQLASPEKRVVLVTGDGSLMFNVQELETMVRLKLPIIIFVNNDSAWNMIKAMQDSMFARNYVGTLLPDIDYAAIARGFGLNAERITAQREILSAYERAVASGKPSLIDCVTDKRNIPDSLMSFGLVEFGGAFRGLDPAKVAKSLWMMRDAGVERSLYMVTYVRKALLRVNPFSRRGRAR